MENYSFKSVAFGGFDKQDVVRYLEQASEKSAAAQRELEAENETLRRQAAEQAEQLEQLRTQAEELREERDRLQADLEAEAAARNRLEPLRDLEQEVARLTAEADSLRPDAEAYARFKERLGTIECEARKRADDLEKEAAAQTRRMVEDFQNRYQKLMSAFDATSSHVNGELRKIEVTLSQLPRALDQTGAELNELAARLEKQPEEKD